jgi:hypothetical protein
MFYSTLTLRFDPSQSSFDQRPLDEFSKSREILSVREHFFVHGELPHLLLCISWRMPPSGSVRPPKAGEDWRGLLATQEASERFDRIRRWRNETAKKEGKPAYAILTNRQAAEVAALPAPTANALRAIEGLGPPSTRSPANWTISWPAGLLAKIEESSASCVHRNATPIRIVRAEAPFPMVGADSSPSSYGSG